MLICQMTDLHINAGERRSYGVVDTAGALRACVAAITALPQAPDVIVVTGDLVECGRADEYATLRALLAPLRCPAFVLPGNHDDRKALRAAFSEHAYLPRAPAKLHYVIDDYPLRLIALDTVVPMASGGEFDEASARWLDDRLREAPQRPTLVMMHHAPFFTGIGHMDEIGLSGADRFAAVMAAHPQVERVICGHLHRSISTRLKQTIVSTCPSPAHQVALDLSPHAASQFVLEPGGFQLHLWQPPHGLITHTAVIGAYPGPFPFPDEDLTD